MTNYNAVIRDIEQFFSVSNVHTITSVKLAISRRDCPRAMLALVTVGIDVVLVVVCSTMVSAWLVAPAPLYNAALGAIFAAFSALVVLGHYVTKISVIIFGSQVNICDDIGTTCTSATARVTDISSLQCFVELLNNTLNPRGRLPGRSSHHFRADLRCLVL